MSSSRDFLVSAETSGANQNEQNSKSDLDLHFQLDNTNDNHLNHHQKISVQASTES